MALDALIDREIKKCQEANEIVGHGAKYTDCHTTVQRMLNSKVNRELLRRILGPQGLRMWDEEPHLRYNVLRGEQPITAQIPIERGDSFMRLLPDSPEEPYRSCPSNTKCLFSDVHIGQRKLLINEILFMVVHGSKSRTVVYIGAAGGSHTPLLSEMFPNHQFLLYDPAPFSKPLMDYMRKNPRRVSVYNELFPPAPGTQSAKELEVATDGEQGFLLISDIRRRDAEAEAPTNADVDADIELQFDMCRKLNPKAAHLKFRLAYLDPEADPPEPDIEVLVPKGDIYFQPWCGHKSTETRLIITPPYTVENSVMMSSRKYESALFYHNMHGRYRRYNVAALESLELFVGTVYDTCFDCTFERYTLWMYLTSGHAVEGFRDFARLFTAIKKVIGREDERLLK